jgi:hypothetical protein
MTSTLKTPDLAGADIPDSIHEFFGYWNGLPKRGLVPRLEDYLDHAPPRLQPYVGIADVLSPYETRMRLFGTGLVDLAGTDPTGGSMQLLYAEPARSKMLRMVWLTVTQPVGYLCIRTVLSTGGRVIQNPSICLPLDVPTSALKSVITFAYQADVRPEFADGERLHLVQDLRLVDWIDIGAGVPDAPVPDRR